MVSALYILSSTDRWLLNDLEATVAQELITCELGLVKPANRAVLLGLQEVASSNLTGTTNLYIGSDLPAIRVHRTYPGFPRSLLR
jgi:hypothetical protein